MSNQVSVPPIGKWTKPGFFNRHFGAKPDSFAISKRGDSNTPIEIKIGNVHLRWEDGNWINMNLGDISNNSNPPLQEISNLQKENAQLQVECEILLHMLTVTEMKKAKSQRQLADLKQRISSILERIEDEGKSK